MKPFTLRLKTREGVRPPGPSVLLGLWRANTTRPLANFKASVSNSCWTVQRVMETRDVREDSAQTHSDMCRTMEEYVLKAAIHTLDM